MRQPLGVIGIIGAWNYPLQLTLAPLVGALAAGNGAILKPSELTPLFAEALKTAIAEFFAPEEVAVVTGGADVGQMFCSLPFDHLVFTGSTSVGRLVAQAAAKNLTPVTLELGGKSPAIIDPSADLPVTADRMAWGKFLNSGQTCIAPDYALVPRSLVSGFVDALQSAIVRQYPSVETNPDYTSIINDRHLSRLRRLIEDARSKGARIVEINPASEAIPGTSRKMLPTLLLDVTDGMAVMQEEIFGPVLPIIACDSPEQAIAYVNSHDRPLALYWFGNDSRRRDQVLNGTIAGGVTINDTLLHLVQENLPFGGVGPSGHGHYHGEFGFRQFSKEKPIFIQSRFSTMWMLYPPYKPSTQSLVRKLMRWG